MRPTGLARNEDGVTIVEFALIAPVLLISLLGVFDLGHGMYTSAQLVGKIQKVARDSTIEGANNTTLDAKVTQAVQIVAPGATTSFTRKSYHSFTAVNKAEDFSDGSITGFPADGICNHGEAFQDANGNGVWDADAGKTGNGGARDAVLYEVTVSYPRVFPVAKLLGQSNTMTIKAATVLRNQPFTTQAGSTAGTCP